MAEKKQYHLTESGKDLFTGKTVAKVESSFNIWKFFFTDDTFVELEGANLWTGAGSIAGISVSDSSK